MREPLHVALVLAVAIAGALAGAGCVSWHAGAMPGEPHGAHFAELEGARVRYVDEGHGPTVVLLHGYASALETWNGVRPALVRAGYRVLALDLKGFGWTDRPEGDYSPEAQARLVLALMRARGVDRAAIVAHSWGSSVALALARLAPGRVSRLVLYDAFVYSEQVPTLFEWARTDGLGELFFGLFYGERADERITLAFYDPRQVTEVFVQDVERALERPGTRAAALATARGMQFAHTSALARRVSQPVLLLWGREDVVAPPEFGERLAADLPDARLVTYARCGHFPMIEARAASTRALVTFLREDER